MPSKSPKQARTMQAAAHNPAFAKKLGIPQGVAKDFEAADRDHHEPAFADGGRVSSGTATQRQALYQHRKNRAKE